VTDEPDPATAGTDAPTRTSLSSGSVYRSGHTIGPYVIEGPLGQGGMGEVYRARDTRLHREVAIKVLRGAVSDDNVSRRVVREARAAAQLNHPGIAAVYDVLEQDGRTHIVMEYVRGPTLAERVRGRRLESRDVLAFGLKIADALACAHAAGIVHCDLKPANIRLADDDAVKILDFGLARRSQRAGGIGVDRPVSGLSAASLAGLAAGTPGYMSPEQLIGLPLDERTDVYSLAVMLYEMAAGRRPFEGSDVASARLAMLERVAPELPSDVPPTLRAVISKGLSRVPIDRYASVVEMRDALLSAGITNGGASNESVRRPRFSRQMLVAAAVLAAAAVLTIVGWRMWRQARSSSGPTVIAVMPFDQAGPASSGGLTAGIADVLTADLSHVPDLVVLPRSATLGNIAAGKDYARIARDLGVRDVITGSVQSADGLLRVTIAIVTATQGRTVWTEHFDGRVSDVFALEQQITNAVIGHLPQFTAAARRSHPTAPTTTSVEAFEDYSQGRAFLDRNDITGNIDRALALFRQAVLVDSRFTLAQAAIGEACWLKYLETRDPQWTEKARDATIEALRLDPDQPMVRYALALIYQGTGKRGAAAEELQKAIALQPSSDEFHRLLGRVYTTLQQTDDAVREFRIALRLRPGFWDTYRALGVAYYNVGRYDEAIAAFTRMTELQPDSAASFQTLGTAYQAKGDTTHALEAYDRANAVKPSATAWNNIGILHHQESRFDAAVAAYEKSIALQPKEPTTYRNLGDTYTRLRNPERARAAYEKAVTLTNARLAVDPHDGPMLSLQALCEAKLGRTEQAVRVAGQAVAVAPASAIVLYRAAVVNVFATRFDDAVKLLQSALEHGYGRRLAAEDEDLDQLRRLPKVVALLKEN
jgi:serine/threonine protein kinase/tetratricopeptide (TPR) repeat protein